MRRLRDALRVVSIAMGSLFAVAACGRGAKSASDQGGAAKASSPDAYPDDSIGALILPIFDARCGKLDECKMLGELKTRANCVEVLMRTTCSSGNTECNAPDAKEREASAQCVVAIRAETCDALVPSRFPDVCPKD